MKNTKLVKIFVLVTTFALLIGAAALVVASAEEKTPGIIGKNIEYTDKTAIQIAVDPATVDASDVSLVVTKADGTELTVDSYKISDKDVNGVSGALIFSIDGVPASAICDKVTVVVKSGDAESTPLTYSVAEYFYERLYSDGIINAIEGKALAQKTLYERYLSYGAGAQDLFRNYDNNGNYVGGTTLVTDYNVLAVEKGVLENGNEVMISPDSFTTTVTANAALAADKTFAGKWTVTTYGETVTTETVANGAEVTANGIVAVTPIYTDATGAFYINESITGKRLDYDADGATAYPISDGSAYVTSSVSGGSLVFSRIPNTEGEGYMSFSNLNTKNNVFVFEADTRFSGFTTGTTAVIKIRFQVGGIDEQMNIGHSGNTITLALSSGTGTVDIAENEWCNLRIELNIANRTYNIFVGNEYKGTLTSTSSSTTGSARVLFYLLKNGYNGVVEMDNIYYGFVEKGTAISQN